MTSFFLGTNQDTSIVPLTKFMLRLQLAFIKCSGLVYSKKKTYIPRFERYRSRHFKLNQNAVTVYLNTADLLLI